MKALAAGRPGMWCRKRTPTCQSRRGYESAFPVENTNGVFLGCRRHRGAARLLVAGGRVVHLGHRRRRVDDRGPYSGWCKYTYTVTWDLSKSLSHLDLVMPDCSTEGRVQFAFDTEAGGGEEGHSTRSDYHTGQPVVFSVPYAGAFEPRGGPDELASVAQATGVRTGCADRLRSARRPGPVAWATCGPQRRDEPRVEGPLWGGLPRPSHFCWGWRLPVLSRAAGLLTCRATCWAGATVVALHPPSLLTSQA